MFIFKSLAWLLCLIVGSLCIAWYLNPDVLHYIDRFSEDTGAKTYALGIGVSICALCTLAALFGRTPKKQQNICLQKERGDIIVNLGSIEHSLIRYGLEDPDIKQLKIDFTGRGKGLRIRVSAIVWEMQDVPSKVENLQVLLNNRFREIMGPMAQDMKVDVILKKISPRKIPSSTPSTTPAIAEDSSFDGNAAYPDENEKAKNDDKA